MRLIDADALIAEIVQTTTFIKDSVLFQKMIDEAPTVSADRPSGKWIEAQIDTSQFPIYFLECSGCGYRIGRETYLENTFNYCPSCGARMKGGAE